MSDNEPSELSEYTVTIGGVDHTLQLDEETAERYGDMAKKTGGKVDPVGGGDSGGGTTEAKAVTSPANKARTGTSK